VDFVTLDYYRFFLPALVVLIFALRNKDQSSRIMLLLASSYVFFWFSSGLYVLLLLGSTLVDFIAGKRLFYSTSDKEKRLLLTASLSFNLGILALFKYSGFFYRSVDFLTNGALDATGMPEPNLLLPVGISFYTFQTLSYSIDMYRKKGSPYENFLDFACYAAFFPQLVAGPIVRSDHFRAQIERPVNIRSENIRIACLFISFGLMKKMVIADNLAVQVDAVFSGDDVLLGNFFWVLWGAVCFGIQIYCDFSGYTDIAIGSARLFGIEIPENFDSPYIAKNFREFWRRWHISLSTWLRDYLYISLGGSRNGVLRMYIALMATMVLGGLWHGANWNFLLWGIVHGALLCGQRVIELGSFGELPRGKLASAASLLLTQYFVFLTWIIFRVSDVGVLVPAIKTFLHLGATYGFSEFWSSLPAGKFTAVLLMGIFIVSHVFGGLTCRNRNRFLESGWLTSLIAIVIMLTLVVLIQPPQPVTFIYFRF